MHDVFEILLQALDHGLNLATLFLRPGAEFLRRHHLPFLGGRQREAERRAQQNDVLLGSLVAQRGKRLALFLLEALVDGAAPRLIILALKYRRQRGGKVIDQLVHRVVEDAGAPGRQLDGNGPVRIGEIIDIDPVGRARRLCPPPRPRAT